VANPLAGISHESEKWRARGLTDPTRQRTHPRIWPSLARRLGAAAENRGLSAAWRTPLSCWAFLWVALSGMLLSGLALEACGQLPVSQSGPKPTEPITIAADSIRNWTQDNVRVLLLSGNVYIGQGLTRVRAAEAVVWVYEQPPQGKSLTRIDLYAEGKVRREGAGKKSESANLFESFETRVGLEVQMQKRLAGPAVDSPVYQRAEARRASELPPADVQQAGFDGESLLAIAGNGSRRLRVSPRSLQPFQTDTFRVSPEEQAVVITGGINLVIDNVRDVGTVDILTDRMVIWTRTTDAPRFSEGETTQSADTPLELYLEGNVIVRQGDRVIEAKQMFYDVNRGLGVANDAEIQAVIEELNNPIYVRAQKLRQVGQNKFIAEQTLITPSRFQNPTYDIEIEQVTLDGIPEPVTNPRTGEPGSATRHRLIGESSFLHSLETPVFYWPHVETTLEEFHPPLRRFSVGQSRVFGTEVHTTWDPFQLFGWKQPKEITRADLNLDYLSDRGPSIGSEWHYSGHDLFGIEGKYWGIVDTRWIDDHGKDNMGRGRKNIEPEDEQRGRFLWRHRQLLPEDFALTLEFGWISDVNFLEQFFEREWEDDKDQETLIYLKQQRDNWAWSVLAKARVMDFLTTTDYLPQLDFYLLGEPLFGDRFTYFTHSSLGYLELLDADRSIGDIPGLGSEGPTFNGARGDTLHELDLPFSVGPFRVVPYVMGRATGWSETMRGGWPDDGEGRLYGAIGSRVSMPLWRVYPGVESDLWNVHGLAHKIVLSMDYFLAQSDLPFNRLPQYDELEDDSEQVFRRRFMFRDFGSPPGVFPAGLDPRRYAIRTGLMTAPESVDDLQALRLDARQRLQTKRGVPGQRHIIDWMTLDTSVTWFPQPDRDNFGEDFGLWSYDYAWHIGDRTSILSSGWFETYDHAPKMWNAGLYIDRPPRGSFYVGYNILEPINSHVIHTSYNYWMSPKYVSSFTTSYDFGEQSNLGQSLVLTRIGADLVFRLGFHWNPLRDNFGFGFEFEPRLDPDLHLGSINGPRIPLQFAPVE
jgi:lipopolysaccharide export system protein LptA